MEISQNQFIEERDYATIKRKSVYDDHKLDLCNTAALNAWGRFGEIGKKIESYKFRLYRTERKATDFLQKWTSAVNKMIPNSEARKIIIKSLAFENAHLYAKG